MARPELSDSLLTAMRAAVEAARAARDGQLVTTAPEISARELARRTGFASRMRAIRVEDAESVTEPLPELRAAIASLDETIVSEPAPPAAGGLDTRPDRPGRDRPASHRRDMSRSVRDPSPRALRPDADDAVPAATGFPVQVRPLTRAATRLAPSADTTSDAASMATARARKPVRTNQPKRARTATGTARLRHHRVASLAALSAILLAACIAGLVLSTGMPSLTSGNAGSGKAQSPGPASIAANAAASWIAGQVSHDAYVACDPAMCQALTEHRFPGRQLQLIRPDSPYPLHAQVVVVTPVVQRQFGNSLATDWAPAVLASFGTGASTISIRIIAPQGAATYEAGLKTDLRQRVSGGAGLLQSPQVKASPQASKLLRAGRVDTRLIVALTGLAALKPIDILGFGTRYPGASPGMPLRTAYLAQDDTAAGLSRSAYLKFLVRELDQQRGSYRPLSARPSHDGAGQPILLVTFAAPSPLLLLGGQGP